MKLIIGTSQYPLHVQSISYAGENNIKPVQLILDPTNLTAYNTAIMGGGNNRDTVTLTGYTKTENSITADIYFSYFKDAYIQATKVSLDYENGSSPLNYYITKLSKSYQPAIPLVFYNMELIETL